MLASEESTTMEHKQKDWFGPQHFYLGIDVGGHSSGQWA